MRVFLRFIYAGYVHPLDWDVTEEVTASSNVETVAVLRTRCMEHDQKTFTATSHGFESSVLLDVGDSIDFEFTFRRKGDCHIMIGIAPSTAQLCAGMHMKSGFYMYSMHGCLSGREVREAARGVPREVAEKEVASRSQRTTSRHR
jgi:hypothetical protein